MRRVIDILFGLGCLVVALPMMLLIAVLIKRDSPGPIFFIQRVVGQNGALFPLFRFRTMYAHSTHLSPGAQQFTPVGRCIRNYSLDHLPTLINLLIGHITLVGPRPMELAVVDLHDPIWRAYVAAKPGLLNYAVLALGKTWTPRRATQPERNQVLELAYLRRRSWRSDTRLFARWVAAFVSSRGNVKARKAADGESLRD